MNKHIFNGQSVLENTSFENKGFQLTTLQYLDKLNIRLSQLNQNVVNKELKEDYIKLFSDNLYSFFYQKDLKINYEGLEILMSCLLNGVEIEGQKYGGLYQVTFTDTVAKMHELIHGVLKDFVEKKNYETIIIYLPNQNNRKSEVNSFIFGYQIFKYFRETNVRVKFIKNLFNVYDSEASEEKSILMILDDYSLTGKNFSDRVVKVSRIVSANITILFTYIFLLTDTLYQVLSRETSVPSNFYLCFHTMIFNFPIFRFNYVTEGNSRFFCLCEYYKILFEFIYHTEYNKNQDINKVQIMFRDETKNKNKKEKEPKQVNYKKIFMLKKESSRNWYLYCQQLSMAMDLIDLPVQKIISGYFQFYHKVCLNEYEFYLPTSQVFNDYESIQKNDICSEKNIFLTGKLQSSKYLKYIF
jgi:hypothetical protein